LGLAVANSISAVSAGASQIEGTIDGIGERAGNAALEEIIMNIRTRNALYGFDTTIDTKRLYRTCTLVASVIGLKIPPNKAVVGANAFAHEAGIHQHGVMANRETYEIMSPESIGIPDNKMLLGKHSGRHAFEKLLEDMGYSFSEEKIAEYFEQFKQLADRKKFISRRDVEALLPKVSRAHTFRSYKLSNYEISAYRNSAFSEITLSCDGNTVTEKESGDGPVDASFKAINNIIGKDFKLLDFSIHAVTEGKDALGEASVKLSLDDNSVSGRGVSTDVLESAIMAYINAANKLLNETN
jgi:Isopropylmalate/homocitrate/citramalate synthases